MNETQIRKIFEQLTNLEERISKIEKNNFNERSKETHSSQQNQKESDDLVLAIVNKIGDCDESEEIQNMVLDKTGQEGKILTCFYVSYKYFKNVWLTTGDVEKITSTLGCKVAIGNVSNKIKSNLRQYLESGAVRKHGQPTPYRLNRKGAKRFNEIIKFSEK